MCFRRATVVAPSSCLNYSPVFFLNKFRARRRTKIGLSYGLSVSLRSNSVSTLLALSGDGGGGLKLFANDIDAATKMIMKISFEQQVRNLKGI